MRIDGPNNAVLGFNSMSDIGPSGTTDWNQYWFDLDVSPDAVDVYFGALQTGDGTAWFDKVTVDVDGIRYLDGPAPYGGEPTAAQLNWLQQAVHPLSSPSPTGDLSDFSPVSNIVGDAHIVGLGEGAHGASEFFQMKPIAGIPGAGQRIHHLRNGSQYAESRSCEPIYSHRPYVLKRALAANSCAA